jgi:hypothetical protein
MQISNVGDSHLLEISESGLRIADTFAQVNAVSFMHRAQFVTKNGSLRSFVNGAAVSSEIEVQIPGALRIWRIPQVGFVISTFDSTVVVNENFQRVESSLCETEQTLLAFANGDAVVQVLPTFAQIVDGPKIEFEVAVTAAEFGFGRLALAFSDHRLALYTINGEFHCESEKAFEMEIGSVAVGNDRLAVSFWRVSKVIELGLPDLTEISQLEIDSLFISSILYSATGELVVGGSGEVFVGGRRLSFSNSGVDLRLLDDQVFLLSDQCGFLKDDVIHRLGTAAAFDAAVVSGNQLAFLTVDGINVVSVENDHHSHIEDYRIINHSIGLIATDESRTCPLVFAAAKAGCFSLISPGLPAVRLSSLEIPNALLWVRCRSEIVLAIACKVERCGKLVLFNRRLERLSEVSVNEEIDALTFVGPEFIVCGIGPTIVVFKLGNDFQLIRTASAPTRIRCASLTCPNSNAVVYADRLASVIVFTVVDGQISEIGRDFNPKALKFARLESETDIIAIGEDCAIYDIVIDNGSLSTPFAFKGGCEFAAVLSAPDLTFVTSSGAVCVIMKGVAEMTKIFEGMKRRIRGAGSMTIDEFRKVERNGKLFELGKFVDGDFVLLFLGLEAREQELIARIAGLSVEFVIGTVTEFAKELSDYRLRTQERLLFSN